MREQNMTTERVGALSDGMIAVTITISCCVSCAMPRYM